MDSIRTYKEAVALITGAGSGLGRALAVELARRGASLHLSDVDTEGLDQTAAAGGALAARSKQTAWTSASRLPYGRGCTPRRGSTTSSTMPASQASAVSPTGTLRPTWDATIDVNLKGVVNGMHAAYSVMVRQGFGHIVNTASLGGVTTMPLSLPYTATKHAVVGLSKALRAEAAARGIRVSALCPGIIRTPILTAGDMRGCERLPDERRLQWTQGPLKPIDPEPWARETLDRVARNEALVIVPRGARIAAALFRWFPGLAEKLTQRGFARMLQVFPELEQAPRAGLGQSPRASDERPEKPCLVPAEVVGSGP